MLVSIVLCFNECKCMINTCKNTMIWELWIALTAIHAVPGLQAPCGGHAPHPPLPSRAELQEVRGSRPRGCFSNSRTLWAVCERMAGAAINTTGTRAMEGRGCLRGARVFERKHALIVYKEISNNSRKICDILNNIAKKKTTSVFHIQLEKWAIILKKRQMEQK